MEPKGMNHLDLFSGIGGFALAARNVGWSTVGFCEIDPFCQKVLKKRFDAPVWSDIRELNGHQITKSCGEVGIVTGGFPCQPFSIAARGRNNAEDLWPEMLRLIHETRPLWVVAENVSGNQLKHIERACADLSSSGYECWPVDLAVETRRHNRRRFWIVAHANRDSKPDGTEHEETPILQEITRYCADAYTDALGMANGLSDRVDRRKRLKALGNAIVPQIAEIIFRSINSASLTYRSGEMI